MNVNKATLKLKVNVKPVLYYVGQGSINYGLIENNMFIMPNVSKPYIQKRKYERYEYIYKRI